MHYRARTLALVLARSDSRARTLFGSSCAHLRARTRTPFGSFNTLLHPFALSLSGAPSPPLTILHSISCTLSHSHCLAHLLPLSLSRAPSCTLIISRTVLHSHYLAHPLPLTISHAPSRTLTRSPSSGATCRLDLTFASAFLLSSSFLLVLFFLRAKRI